MGLGSLSDRFAASRCVHRGNDYLHDVPRGGRLLHELRFPGALLVRTRSSARLRLPDRAHDHFRKHPKHEPRPPGLGGVVFPTAIRGNLDQIGETESTPRGAAEPKPKAKAAGA